jgi:hypothetical protein
MKKSSWFKWPLLSRKAPRAHGQRSSSYEVISEAHLPTGQTVCHVRVYPHSKLQPYELMIPKSMVPLHFFNMRQANKLSVIQEHLSFTKEKTE